MSPTAALAEAPSSKGWWWWRQTLSIDPDSTTISEPGDTTRLFTILSSAWERDAPPTLAEADWFLLDPEVAAIEGSATATRTVLLRGLKPGMARIIAIHDGLAALAHVSVDEGDPGEDPVPVAAVASDPQPVLFVGDTLTVRPNLIDEDSVVIPTEPSEWTTDFDSAVVSVSEDFLVTALAPTPPGSTSVVSLTHTDTELATEVGIVVLPDEDPVPVAAVASDEQPVLLVGDTVTIRPELIDEDSVVIPTEPSEWSIDFDPTFLSVSDEFLVTAQAPTPPGSSSGVTLTHTDTELAVDVEIVILPDADPGEWPDNEPPGMMTIAAVDGSSKDWPGFSQISPWQDDNRVTVVSDPDSKHGRAVEKRFFIGDESGWHGFVARDRFRDGACSEVYMRIVFRISPNWQWHQSGSKFLYWGSSGRSQEQGPTQFYINATGSGQVQFVDQTASGDVRGTFRANAPPISRNRYHTIEFLHVANTPGNSDGSLRMWIDGIEVESFSHIGHADRSDIKLENLRWVDFQDTKLTGALAYMFWGGQGDTKRVNDWIRISELYISGKH